MVAPSKVSYRAPAPSTNAQANALRTACSDGLIIDHHTQKNKIIAHFNYLRSCAPYPLTATQLADINRRQNEAIFELNHKLDLKIAAILHDAGSPAVLEPADLSDDEESTEFEQGEKAEQPAANSQAPQAQDSEL